MRIAKPQRALLPLSSSPVRGDRVLTLWWRGDSLEADRPVTSANPGTTLHIQEMWKLLPFNACSELVTYEESVHSSAQNFLEQLALVISSLTKHISKGVYSDFKLNLSTFK